MFGVWTNVILIMICVYYCRIDNGYEMLVKMYNFIRNSKLLLLIINIFLDKSNLCFFKFIFIFYFIFYFYSENIQSVFRSTIKKNN